MNLQIKQCPLFKNIPEQELNQFSDHWQIFAFKANQDITAQTKQRGIYLVLSWTVKTTISNSEIAFSNKNTVLETVGAQNITTYSDAIIAFIAEKNLQHIIKPSPSLEKLFTNFILDKPQHYFL